MTFLSLPRTFLVYHNRAYEFLDCFKGQIISKANCQAVNSSKKRTNEFVFTNMGRVFVCFLEEIGDTKRHFEIN